MQAEVGKDEGLVKDSPVLVRPVGSQSLQTPGESRLPRGFWLIACLLAALGQMTLAGYQMGVGNQTIQIPFLKRALDSNLYSNDAMVNQTIGDYPSFFYPIAAKVVGAFGLLPAYFWMHLLTTFFTLAFLYALARGMFHVSRWAYGVGAVMVVLVLAGHHKALAGDSLYTEGFTHTYAVLPLAILAMVLAYRDKLTAAWIVVGVLFNFHALTAAYVGAPLFVLTAMEIKRRGWLRSLIGPGAALAIAIPTLFVMATHRQVFDEAWVTLTYIRSADHSFPSYWWQQGNKEVPRFVLLLALAGLSFSFAQSRRTVKTSLVFAGVIVGLFAIGYLFSEWAAVPTVLRAQLFRASRILLILALAHIAFGVIEGILVGWKLLGQNGKLEARNAKLIGVLEILAAVATLLVVAMPSLVNLLPHVLLLVTVTALVSGRLSWIQAGLSGAAILTAIAAWRTIEFPIPGMMGDGIAKYLRSSELHAVTWISGGVLAGAAIVFALPWVWGMLKRRLQAARLPVSWSVAGLGFVGFCFAAQQTYKSEVTGGGEISAQSRDWVDIQKKAKAKTPAGAVILTPPELGGFRIFSERAVVMERRDGTQLYFTGAFASVWKERLEAMLPETKLDDRAAQWRGKLEDLSDEKLREVAKAYEAQYVVLPASAGGRGLKEVDRNAGFVLYETSAPKMLGYSKGAWTAVTGDEKAKPQFTVSTTVEKPPAGIKVVSEMAYLAQDGFMREVVLPNIEKHRKSDALIEIVDENDMPVSGKLTATQVAQRFDFGCSLPFFAPVSTPAPGGDYKPAVVKPVELERFREAGFNYSMIPFSAKWAYLEPVEGQWNFAELDKYVEFCEANGVGAELHYLGGLPPAWLPRGGRGDGLAPVDLAFVKKVLLRHAETVAKRYGDRIKYYQVTNDWYPQDLPVTSYAKELFDVVRKHAPKAKLGFSDCARLTSAVRTEKRELDLCIGIDKLRAVQQAGVKVDYFAPHAHKPFGLWPDAAEMYEAFDAWGKTGVKIHLTEVFVPVQERVYVPASSGGGGGFQGGGGGGRGRRDDFSPGPGSGGGRGSGNIPANPAEPASTRTMEEILAEMKARRLREQAATREGATMPAPASQPATKPATKSTAMGAGIPMVLAQVGATSSAPATKNSATTQAVRAASSPATKPAAATAASAPAIKPATTPATSTKPAFAPAVTRPATAVATAPAMTRVVQGSPIYGPVIGGQWNRQLQAEHFTRFITICFSHPDVEAVNLWCLGPDSRMLGEGILDEKYEPTPAFEAVKKLIRETFTTRVEQTVSVDGLAKFRGFHGDYKVTLTLSDGAVVTGSIALEQGAETKVKLKVNRAKGTLEIVK